MKSFLPLLAATGAYSSVISRQASESLDALMKAKGKLYFGTCTDRGLLTGGSAPTIQANFGQVTPENSMKWDQTEPQQGSWTLDNADFLVDWAQENNQTVRGHTCVWHSQLAGWVNNVRDRDALTKVIQDHTKEIVGRYKGKIRAWDVVNEMFNEDGSLRQSVFSDVLGEDFVRIAFEAAREADPDAILYINDYNLDSASYAKVTNGMVAHVKKWVEAGWPIDGIGSQGHIQGGMGGQAQAVLEALASTGVKEVAITELDIANAPASDYAAVTRACLNVPQCVGVTVWGVRDQDSWRSNTNPLLFSGNYQPKGAYQAVVDAINEYPDAASEFELDVWA